MHLVHVYIASLTPWGDRIESVAGYHDRVSPRPPPLFFHSEQFPRAHLVQIHQDEATPNHLLPSRQQCLFTIGHSCVYYWPPLVKCEFTIKFGGYSYKSRKPLKLYEWLRHIRTNYNITVTVPYIASHWKNSPSAIVLYSYTTGGTTALTFKIAPPHY